MALRASVELRIPFHDLDPLNVVWHGNYYKYFEAARQKLLESIAYDVPEMKASGYAWPVIESLCRYMQPLHYHQNIRVTARLLEFERRLKILYEIHDVETGKRLSRGHTTQVAVAMETGEMCVESPPVLRQKIEAAT